MSQLHPNEVLRRAGISIAAGATTGGVANTRDVYPASPVADEYPSLVTICGGFTRLPLDGTAIRSGHSAWYPLIRLKMGKGAPLGLAVFGLTLEQTSPDILGAGGGTGGSSNAQAWGTKHGEGAAVIFGTNLPTRDSGWSSGVCMRAGVEDSGNGLLVQSSQSNEIWGHKYPPGSYNDPVPVSWTLGPTFQPYVVRLLPGHRLDVAFVVKGSVVNGVSNKYLYGYTMVQMHLGLPEANSRFAHVGV